MDHSVLAHYQICILPDIAKMNINPDDMCDYCYLDHATKSLAQRPFECNFCIKTFKSKDSLRGHKNKYHSDTTNADKIEQLLEQCIRILDEARKQARQKEAAAQEEHPKRPRHVLVEAKKQARQEEQTRRLDMDTYGSCHVASTVA